MTYDYISINFASVSGIVFLLIFLHANSSLETGIRRIFYVTVFLEFIEMVTYSLELWTTTFEMLSPLRLWLSAIGYSVRPFIFCLMLMLALRNTEAQHFPKKLYLPAIINVITSFSVFFTDIVYSYTPDNKFQRGPLGYMTHMVVILYLIILMVVVTKSHEGRPKLETLIIFAISMLLFISMAIEAAFSIRTVGRTSIIMVTIFYYMFFQTRIHNDTLVEERLIRQQLEHASKIDGSTGVLTKNAFTLAVKELMDIKEGQQSLSAGFVFVDLDHLKKVNDTLGHAMGDIAISDAVQTIQNACRKRDLVGRFGGDEFYVFLPGIPKQRFLVYLNEVQAKLQKEYSVGDVMIAVSASIGAVYMEDVQNINYEQLVHLADEALYQAKASGRNCHVVREL